MRRRERRTSPSARFIRQSEFNTFGRHADNSLGLTLDPFPRLPRPRRRDLGRRSAFGRTLPYPVDDRPQPERSLRRDLDTDDDQRAHRGQLRADRPRAERHPRGLHGLRAERATTTGPIRSPGRSTRRRLRCRAPDRQPNVFGWYQAPVTIDWQAQDDSSQLPILRTRSPIRRQDVRVHQRPELRPVQQLREGHADVSLTAFHPCHCRPAPLFEVERGSAAFLFADVSDALPAPRVTQTPRSDISSACTRRRHHR